MDIKANLENRPKPNPAELIIRWNEGSERLQSVAELVDLIQKGLSAKATIGLNYFFWISGKTIGLWMVFEHLEVGSLQRMADLCGRHGARFEDLGEFAPEERDKTRMETMSKAEHTYIGWADLRVGFESFQLRMGQAR